MLIVYCNQYEISADCTFVLYGILKKGFRVFLGCIASAFSSQFLVWINKKSTPSRGVLFFESLRIAYPSMIASLGQTPAQVPQSMHLSGSMT